jgi:hypothetical protein
VARFLALFSGFCLQNNLVALGLVVGLRSANIARLTKCFSTHIVVGVLSCVVERLSAAYEHGFDSLSKLGATQHIHVVHPLDAAVRVDEVDLVHLVVAGRSRMANGTSFGWTRRHDVRAYG